MDRKLVERWITALRSGDYLQGIGRLWGVEQGEDRYCCLGVLMEIEGTEAEKSDHRMKGFSTNSHSPWFRERSIGVPGDTFNKRVGLPDRMLHNAIEMNDAGKSFKTIANHIEEELL